MSNADCLRARDDDSERSDVADGRFEFKSRMRRERGRRARAVRANDAAHSTTTNVNVSRLTERQQLARAMAESCAMTPARATARDATTKARGEGAAGERDERRDAAHAGAARDGDGDGRRCECAAVDVDDGRAKRTVEGGEGTGEPGAVGVGPARGATRAGAVGAAGFLRGRRGRRRGGAWRTRSGAGKRLEPKTFDRALALRGDDAREGGGGANEDARTKPREKATREKETKRASAATATKTTTGTKSRERSSKAAAVTPIVFVQDFGRRRGGADGEEADADEREDDARIESPCRRRAIEVVDVAEKENKPIAGKKATEQREVGARVKRSGAGVLRDSNGAAAKKEATPAEVAPAAKKRKTPPAPSVAKDTKTVVKAFQTPAATKKRAIAPVEEKTPSREDLALRKLTVARKRRMEAQLELVLAKTYVRAIKRPIIPQAKPSQRLLDAYRAFSLACAANREAPPKPAARPRTLEFGAALARGVDTLRAEDESVAAGVN